MSEDRCVCCGSIVPEGRMVCPNCEKEKPMKNLSHGEMVQIAEGKKNRTPRYIDANRLIDLAMHEGAYGYVDVHDIYNVPTADVVEINCAYNKNEDTPSLFWCSNCDWRCSDTTSGDKTDGDDPYNYNYCPNCGRRIRRKEDAKVH